MIVVEPTRSAQLVASIHVPVSESIAECLSRWSLLDRSARARSYLVVEGATPGTRYTLNSERIAKLAAQPQASEQFVLPA